MWRGIPAALFEGAKARVCPAGPRVLHVSLGNGKLGLDLTTIEDHPTAGPMHVQCGYCYTCDQYEWKRLSSQTPETPIMWIDCHKKINK